MSHKEPTTCPVCFNQFNAAAQTPKILPACGHTICKKCLKQLLQYYNSKCPLDKTPLSSNPRSVDSFPTNFIAQDIIENNRKYPRCKHHPEEREKVICMTDKKMICTDCVLLGDHKDHEVRSLTEAQSCAQLKINQLQDILDKIKTNVSQFDKSIQEKEENMKKAIKKRFNYFYKAIKKHEAQMLSQVESVLREEKARAKNPRLRDRASEIESKLLELSSLISTPRCIVVKSEREVVNLFELDSTELQQIVANEFTFASQKIEEFTSLLAVFENSLPKEDLLKELNIDTLEQNLADWNKNRVVNLGEAKEIIIPSAISLEFKGDTLVEVEFKEETLVEVWKAKLYKKSTEYFAYDKPKLDQVEEVSYGLCVNDEKDKDALLPALRELSKSLSNAKSVSFNFERKNGQRIRSNEGLCNTVAAILSEPKHIEKLKFSFANDFVGDLAFLFLAETVLPKIKNLTSFCIKMEKPGVSDQTLKAFAQVNWKAWPNLEELRVDIPKSSFKEDEVLQFLNCVPNIKCLSLGFGNTQLTDSALVAFSTNILPSLDKLERLEVGFWNTKLTDVGVEAFLMNLPNIERLLIGFSRTCITENVIKLFLDKRLPSLNLKEFQFEADHLSEDTVRQLCDWKEKINKGLDELKDIYNMNFRSWHKTWKAPKAPAPMVPRTIRTIKRYDQFGFV